MATFTWEVYAGSTPGWMTAGANRHCLSGSATLIDTAITLGQYNTGSHLGNGTPGTDQCGTNHARNVKYVAGTQFDSGGGTETLNDTNLAQTECSLRIVFTDAASVTTTNGKFYCFDNVTPATEAVGIQAYAFERGVSATAWTLVNEDSTSYGGDGECLSLSNHASATQTHYFYLAVSAKPLTVGSKTEFAWGISLTYS